MISISVLEMNNLLYDEKKSRDYCYYYYGAMEEENSLISGSQWNSSNSSLGTGPSGGAAFGPGAVCLTPQVWTVSQMEGVCICASSVQTWCVFLVVPSEPKQTTLWVSAAQSLIERLCEEKGLSSPCMF